MIRYTLDHTYPNCPFEVGAVLAKDYMVSNATGKAVQACKDDAGHIILLSDILTSIESGCNAFRMLNWWEELELCDLPRYLRYKDGALFKVGHYIFGINRVRPKYGEGHTDTTHPLLDCEPSSEQEYQDYLNGNI
jgi:hypothetical protein